MTLPEATLTDFANFRAAVTSLYPGADDDCRYAESDLRRLVNVHFHYRIETRAELGYYYREFRRLAIFLINKGRLSSIERDKMFMDGFRQPLRGQIKQRLQYLKPTHFPDDPYDWKEVHDSAYFLLSGTPSTYPPNTTPRIPQITGQATPYIPTTTAQPPPMMTISYQPAQVLVAPAAAPKVKMEDLAIETMF